MQPYQLLEVRLAEWLGLESENMVACSSGTAALHLAFESLLASRLAASVQSCSRYSSICIGDSVLLPDFTMIACPRAVTMAGLSPIFVDCGNDLNCLTEINLTRMTTLRGHLYRSVSAVMPVHVYGRQCDVAKVRQLIGNRHTLLIIEDMAELHGYPPDKATDVACWSFYQNKVVSGEEGGAVYFREKEPAQLARKLRTLGFTEEHDFNHIPRGHNYRLSNAHASLILASLSDYEEEIKRRREVEHSYNFWCPPEWKMPERQSPWIYDLRIPGLTSKKQTEIVKALNTKGIAARHAFKPMSKQPEFLHCLSLQGSGGHNAEMLSREVFYLPLRKSDLLNSLKPKDLARFAFDVIKQTFES